MNKKIIILVSAVAVAAAVCVFWLLTSSTSPSREQDYIADEQDTVTEDVKPDTQPDTQETPDTQEKDETPAEPDDVTDIPETTDAGSAEDVPDGDGYLTEYTDDDNEDTEPAAEPETAYISTHIPVYKPIISDPIPDKTFPKNITGIGILTIESIDLRLPVAEGVEEATLRIAPGRVPQTAQVGEIGNAVIAGHRNHAFGSMFNRLGEIDYGETVKYQARSGEMMEFTVFEIAVIEPEDQIAFIQPINDSIVTLFTCTPAKEATHRLIIRAQRVR